MACQTSRSRRILRERWSDPESVGVVLSSGLGPLADEIEGGAFTGKSHLWGCAAPKDGFFLIKSRPVAGERHFGRRPLGAEAFLNWVISAVGTSTTAPFSNSTVNVCLMTFTSRIFP